jgi:hypothetical protein
MRPDVIVQRVLRRQRGMQNQRSNDLWNQRNAVHGVRGDPAVQQQWAMCLQSDLVSDRVL